MSMPSFVFVEREYGVFFIFGVFLDGGRSDFVWHRRIGSSLNAVFMFSYSNFCCSRVYPQVSVGSIR